MGATRIVVIVVALALAGLAAFLVNKFMIPGTSVTQTADRTIEIVVANELVPAGTILAASHLRWQPWPGSEAELEGVYLFRTKEGETATEQTEAAVKELVGAAVKRAIPKGEPITGDKLCKPEQSGFLACALKRGRRAVGVNINPTTSAAGFVLPGDHVDVIMTQKLRQRSSRQDAEQETTAISLTILCNIQVLAIDQSVDDIDKSAKVGKTATLEVLPKEVQILSLAARMGQLSLALRGVGGDARDGGQDDARDCYNEVVTDIQITPPPPPPPPSGPPSVMVAVRPLAAGRVLRDRDLRWKVLDEKPAPPGDRSWVVVSVSCAVSDPASCPALPAASWVLSPASCPGRVRPSPWCGALRCSPPPGSRRRSGPGQGRRRRHRSASSPVPIAPSRILRAGLGGLPGSRSPCSQPGAPELPPSEHGTRRCPWYP